MSTLKEKIFVMAIGALIGLVLLLTPGLAVAQFAGGTGEQTNPYQIATADHLNLVRNYLDKYFILVADIDLNVAPYNTGDGWEPIGTGSNPFTGSFDGNGYTIRNLYINRPSSYPAGLFGRISGNIRRVGIEGGSVTGLYYVGALVGYNAGGTISDSYSTVSVYAQSEVVGGLVGYNYGGTITNSYASGNVTAAASAYYIGGLVGVNTGTITSKGTITNCYSTGNVTSTGDYVGGLVGHNYRGDITTSYATGIVEGKQRVAGLVGSSWYGEINRSYATGQVTGELRVGGLVGNHSTSGIINKSYALGNVNGVERVGGLVGDNHSEIYDSYSTGDVTGNTNVGGLVGFLRGDVVEVISRSYATGVVEGSVHVGGLVGRRDDNTEITSSYWNTETSGQTIGVGNGSSTGCTGLTTQQMRDQTSFDGWDFAAVWNMEASLSYPWLRDNEQIPHPGKISPSNNLPTKPELVYPANGQQGLDSTVTFKWRPSTDPDGDPVTYDIYYCLDPDPINNCSAKQVASVNRAKDIYHAGISFGGIGTILAGIFMARRERRRLFLLLAAVIISGILINSCGSGGDGTEEDVAGGGEAENYITYTASGLEPGKTYYWAVVAKDDKGGESASDAWSFTTK